ncbi:YGR079W [Zygosaccharomyces parabailii]|uniref:ZYBA0S04-10110g1_1 n=1 Tax=Zygosaccharomyces bailii (strain CLIB 213 / ATCC 58445 / CBS 680 / BCRC 21525 / NBRC 1098 / NCYC 1416 / NRRL Y-2227) TaxID=1333698 RepID=A0A8J2T6P1_ZYGB2|nr:YGR079W [Zygosaccharomyces parabailii]CDF89682.1 ZYBA0S04-10110g1_1 [Zygosaccharomyces bailii CLIB 213]CDH13805.1 uncharacterized protein ZBAI_05591 [Zygosaccharomyces bailii ISA1307]SJM87551.1 uncharacterized protein ZBIST_3740 [Zygosaccharomyces bailii]
MKENRGPRDAGGKPFQLLNSVITGEDITPLPRGGNSDGSKSSPQETTPDPDLLFSPLNAGLDEGDEEDEYDHEFLSPVYFGAAYPKRFHRRSSMAHAAPERKNSTSLSAYSLGEFLTNSKNDDFWKEVGATDEEALCFPETDPLSEPTGMSSSEEPSAQEPCGQEPAKQADLSQFITEDLGSTQPMDSYSWDQDCKVKLLCYRDAEGKLRLRNANGGRVNKKGKKLLKRAIRRKSGVREMVSTGIGIGEFML